MFHGFLDWRQQRNSRLAEWHVRKLPIFRTIELIENKTLYFDVIMRRKQNNKWQYRALTDQEYWNYMRKRDASSPS
jgi:hypothetical protein